MINKLLNYALILLAIVGLAFTLTLFLAYNDLVRLAETYLASDGQIENPRAVAYSIYLFLASVSLILFLLKGAWVYTEKRKNIFSLPFHIKLFYVLFAVTLLFTLLFKPVYAYYKEDGILENVTVLMAFASGFILLYVASLYKFTMRGLFAFALAASVLLFALEEISWGQRIFGWETTALMLEINEQQENNLHNLFNEYFDIGYVCLTGLLASLFFFRDQWIRLFGRYRQTKVFVEFMPSGDLYYTGYFYIFLMLFTLVLDRGGETLEAAIALMFLFYAVDVVKKFEPETELARKMVR